MILIPDKLKSKAKNMNEFIDSIYPTLKSFVERGLKNRASETCINDWDWLMERSILCPKNVDCDDINWTCTKKLSGKEWILYSSDKVLKAKEEYQYPREFLNEIQVSGVPPHKLLCCNKHLSFSAGAEKVRCLFSKLPSLFFCKCRKVSTSTRPPRCCKS